MTMTWYSYSQLAAYQRCARRWRDGGREEQNGAMVIGLAAHHTIARHLLPAMPDAPVNPAFADEYTEGVELAQSFIADYPFPDRDAILDVEGSGIPRAFRADSHGRALMGVELVPGIGLRGVTDLVHVAEEDAVGIVDWKSGNPNENAHALQGAVYATLVSAAWPGFARYVFQPVYLRAPRHDYRLTYFADELPEVRAHVIGLILQMQADRECEPRANRYCGTCPLRDGCPEYGRAITEAPRQSIVQSLSMSQIEAEDRRVAGIAKIITAYRAELAAEQERRVQAGPVVDGDTEWYLGSKLGNRSWEVGPVAAILVGALNAGRISEDQFSACFKIVAGGLEKLKKIAPEEHAAVLALAARESSPEVQKRHVAPQQNIIDVTEAAPSVAEAAVESAVSSLPPAADAHVGPEHDNSGTTLPCPYLRAYSYTPCGRARCADVPVCFLHEGKICWCGEQAMTECSHDRQFVCGEPLCMNHECRIESPQIGSWMASVHSEKGLKQYNEWLTSPSAPSGPTVEDDRASGPGGAGSHLPRPSGEAATGGAPDLSPGAAETDTPPVPDAGLFDDIDMPPVDSSDLPLFAEAEPWTCPHCEAILTARDVPAPLRGHWGLSCQAHGVVAWVKTLKQEEVVKPVQPPAGDIRFSELEKARKTRHRRPTPVCPVCLVKRRWEKAGSPKAYCPVDGVFTPPTSW